MVQQRESSSGGAGAWAFTGLERQAQGLAAGEVSSAELVEAALAAIDSTQDSLNAFRLVRAEAARAEAAVADRRLAGGERASLLGVPVAIKDDMDIAGLPTAYGCAGDFTVADHDSEAVRRLRDAGAVIVGKTNTPEFGQWPFTEGDAFGTTRSPWDLDRSPGGSSGGSAAAVSAGLVAGALGSDGAGSVRIPAAWSNLVGIKPQRGRISAWPDPEAFYGLTCIGPLARTVSDAAYLLDAATGNHQDDRHRPPALGEPLRAAADREPGRLRIALSLRAPFCGAAVRLDPEVRAAVEAVAELLARLGHEITVEDPAYRLIGVSFLCRSLPALTDWGQRVPDLGRLDQRTRNNCRTGRYLSPFLPVARAHERVLHRRVGAIFDHADVVLTPTTASPPLPIGYFDGRSNWSTDQAMARACPYAWPWNVLGWPAVNVPAGLTAEGLPVGAQLLGPSNSEPLLISLAAQLESEQRWSELVPPHTAVAGPRSRP